MEILRSALFFLFAAIFAGLYTALVWFFAHAVAQIQPGLWLAPVWLIFATLCVLYPNSFMRR